MEVADAAVQNFKDRNIPLNSAIGVFADFWSEAYKLPVCDSSTFSDTIKNPDDVERYLNLSVLGSIPVLDEELVRSSSKKNKKNKKVSSHSHVVMTETLSDASRLMREAKVPVSEADNFIEPKEPQSLDRDKAAEVLQENIFNSFRHDRRGGKSE